MRFSTTTLWTSLPASISVSSTSAMPPRPIAAMGV